MTRLVLSLIAGLSTVSLTLLATAAILWARSYRSADVFEFQSASGRWRLVSTAGSLSLDNEPQVKIMEKTWHDLLGEYDREKGRLYRAWDYAMSDATAAAWESLDGKRDQAQAKRESKLAEAERLDQAMRDYEQQISKRRNDLAATMPKPTRKRVAPYNLLVLCFSILPAFRVSMLARSWTMGRRRRRLGLCHECGYSLLGTTSGRCPECGTVADRAA